jgi:hypothetical protein
VTRVLGFLILFVFALANAQETQDSPNAYFGVSIDPWIDFSTGVAPLLGIHYGAQVADNLEIRGALSTILVANILYIDVLYRDAIPDSNSSYYLGGGVDLGFFAIFGAAAFGFHGTVGFEYPVSAGTGLFLELQPTLLIGPGHPFAMVNGGSNALGSRIRAGANFYF